MPLLTTRHIADRIGLLNVEGGIEHSCTEESIARQIALGTTIIWDAVPEPPGFAEMVRAAELALR